VALSDEEITATPSLHTNLASDTALDAVPAAGDTPPADNVRRGLFSPAGQPKHLLPIVGPLTVFGPLCIDMYLPALPRISTNLHADASLAQLSLTTCLIGMAAGQLIFGPISDRYGRRRPLFVGIILFALSSLACVFAPSITILIICRLLQGLGGAAGVVTSRAVVRDVHSGIRAARFFSTLMMATALGPILAPQIGAEVLRVTTWRGIFVVLAGVGVILLVVAATRLPETLPPERRVTGGFAQSRASMASVLKSRAFVANALACSLGFGAIFSYVSGSSFVLENLYHLSPQRYSLLITINGLGMFATSRLNSRIVSRFGPRRLLTFGLAWLGASSVLLLIALGPLHLGLWAVIPTQCFVVMSNGFVMPNAIVLSMQDFPHAAGSASALLGTAQFSMGAFAAPLVGLGGAYTAYPMAIAIVIFGLGAISARLLLIRGNSSAQNAESDLRFAAEV
jgi:MFS transporter, DHA1 family, multidrug resistance protein